MSVPLSNAFTDATWDNTTRTITLANGLNSNLDQIELATMKYLFSNATWDDGTRSIFFGNDLNSNLDQIELTTMKQTFTDATWDNTTRTVVFGNDLNSNLDQIELTTMKQTFTDATWDNPTRSIILGNDLNSNLDQIVLTSMKQTFTGATWDNATRSIIFSNDINSNLDQVVVTDAALSQTSNHFCKMVCYDPVSSRLLHLDFEARDLLLYEWHTRAADHGIANSIFGTTTAYLDADDRFGYIILRRNIRQTIEYGFHETWNARHPGDGGTYSPQSIRNNFRKAVVVSFGSSQGGWNLGGLKSISSFGYTFGIGQGDWANGDIYMVVYYFGMSWGSVMSTNRGTTLGPTNNNRWPYQVDSRITDLRNYQANYLVAT